MRERPAPIGREVVTPLSGVVRDSAVKGRIPDQGQDSG